VLVAEQVLAMVESYFTAVPERIGVEITNRCDLACRHCFNDSGSAPVQELSLAELTYFFEQVQLMGIEDIRISGGEPTLHPEFPAVVNEAHRRGLRISVNTHGLYSSKTRTQVAKLPIRLFIISLDGLRDVNDSIRGSGVFDRAVDTASWLIRQDLAVTLGVHVTRSAVDDVAGLVDLASELGADIKFAPLRPLGRARQNLLEEMLSPSDFYQVVQSITRSRENHPEIQISTDFDILQPIEPSVPRLPSRASCPAGRSMLNLNYDGYVYPCAFLVTPHREFAAGHLHEDSLLSLWRESPAFLPFRTLEKDDVCKGCFAYGHTCAGGCVALSYFIGGHLDAHDPTCFIGLVSTRDIDGARHVD
jgi:radical SAM protein with 4Fe4S-binding SPASM domain